MLVFRSQDMHLTKSKKLIAKTISIGLIIFVTGFVYIWFGKSTPRRVEKSDLRLEEALGNRNEYRVESDFSEASVFTEWEFLAYLAEAEQMDQLMNKGESNGVRTVYFKNMVSSKDDITIYIAPSEYRDFLSVTTRFGDSTRSITFAIAKDDQIMSIFADF